MAPWKQQVPKPSDFKDPAPAGTQPAILVAIVDLGTHTNVYQGQTNTAHKIHLTWELVDEPSHDTIGMEFTLSFHEKAKLRDFVKKWRGRDLSEGEEFDISKMLGVACNLSISHKKSGDRTYAKIDGISGLLRNQQVGKSTLEHVLWSLDDGDHSSLPDWLPYLYGKPLTQWIDECHENNGGGAPAPANGTGTGDAAEAPAGGPVPF